MIILQKIGAPLSTYLSPTPHCWAIKKESLRNNQAWWPLPPAGAVHPHASADSDHQSPSRSTPPHLISHLSFFLMTYSRYQFSDKILEISLIFTHGITPAWVNDNMCFVKKCILMFRAMHEHLACNYILKARAGSDIFLHNHVNMAT